MRVTNVKKNAQAPFYELLNNGKAHVYAIVVLNRVVGRIILFTELEDKDLADGKDVCYFSNLWVHPKLRGKKIGTKLVDYVMEEAGKKGFKYLTLGVVTDNEKNKSIYSHLGFNDVVKNKTCDVVVKDENGEFIPIKENIVLKKKI